MKGRSMIAVCKAMGLSILVINGGILFQMQIARGKKRSL